MFEPTSFLIFMTAGLIMLLTSGPAVFYIIARSIDQGRSAGLVSTIGVGVGTMFHVLTDGSYAMLAGTAGNWLKRNLRVLRAQRLFAGTIYVTLGMITAFSAKE